MGRDGTGRDAVPPVLLSPALIALCPAGCARWERRWSGCWRRLSAALGSA